MIMNLNGINFIIDPLFSLTESTSIARALSGVFGTQNVDNFITSSALNGTDIYLDKTVGPDSQARRTIGYAGATDDDPREVISIGVDILDTIIGTSGVTTSRPGYSSPASLSEILFHELSHAVTDFDDEHGSELGQDEIRKNITNYYAGVEAVAIGAENYIFGKDHSIPSRVGHDNNVFYLSNDPASPFKNVPLVSYSWFDGGAFASSPNHVPNSSANFSGVDAVDGGTIVKSYLASGSGPAATADLNTVYVEGIRSDGVVTDQGNLSQTFSDALSGMLASPDYIKSTVSSIAESIKSLKVTSLSLHKYAAGTSLDELSDALSPVDLGTIHSVIGLSNERYTDGNAINLVGPADAGKYNAPVKNIRLTAAQGSFVIGSSGYEALGEKYNGSVVASGVDFIVGASSEKNVLIAGSEAAVASRNTLVAGDAGDILIGGTGNDILLGGRGNDILFQSDGKDSINGGSGFDSLILDASTTTLDFSKSRKGSSVIVGAADNVTTTTGVEAFVGSSNFTKFVGDGLALMVAGSGGADFTLANGDMAVGSSDPSKKNVFRVSTTLNGLTGNKVSILDFDKSDEIYVDGVKFTGSEVISQSLGWGDPYGDFHILGGGTGISTTGRSSWGLDFPQASKYELYGGSYMYQDPQQPYHYRDVWFEPSVDNGVPNPSVGVIHFIDEIITKGVVTSVNAQLDIYITGFQNGDGGINFSENNLARDSRGKSYIANPDQDAGTRGRTKPGQYYSDGKRTAVGGAFGPASAAWIAPGHSYSTAQQLAAQIAAFLPQPSAQGQTADIAPPGSGAQPGGYGNTGLDADSALTGDASANVLDANGYSGVIGGGGGDTFIYQRGYGSVTIDERDASLLAANTLQFGAGIAKADVQVRADANGDFILSLSGGDQVILLAALNTGAGTAYGVQNVTFADGGVWSYANLLQKVVTASSDSDSLYGDRTANMLDGQGVATTLTGGGGGDTFVYNAGYGSVTINEVEADPSADNVLRFGAGISSTAVTVSGTSDGGLVLSLGSGDQVILAGALTSGAGLTYGVQHVVFADGTSWDYATLLQKSQVASATNLSLYGDGSANILNGNGIATTLTGGGGGDTFVFTNGDTPITIYEGDTASMPDNTLTLHGIAAANVAVRGDADGNLILSIDGVDQITIAGGLTSVSGETLGVQNVVFDDGTTWSYATLLAKADTPSSGNTVLYGDHSANVMNGGGVATTLVGGGGGDTFVYNLGDGSLTIMESDVSLTPGNTLAFGSGIGAAAISATGTAAGDIVLSLPSGDTITLTAALLNGDGETYGVQDLTFVDGTVLQYADLLAMIEAPRAGGTAIFGDAAANTLDTQGLVHEAWGGGGGDSFVYDRGYGALRIHENDTSGAPTNNIVFGAGITAADLAISGTSFGDIVLSLGNGDAITLDAALLGGGSGTPGIQQLTFADGSSLSYADILAQLETPSATNTTLYGDSGSNTIDPLGIAHQVIGNGGDDTIVYNAGYGALTLDETDPSSDPSNVLQLGSGISVAGTTVSATAAGDILLSFGGGDQVTIVGALNSTSSATRGVQEVQFADGTSWSYATLLARADTPSVSNTILYGDSEENVLDGQGMADRLVGNGGADTFIFNQGYGSLTVDEQDASGTTSSTLQIGAGIDPASVSVSANAAGDIVLSLGGSDQVILTGEMNSDGSVAYGVQQVAFADGTIWSYSDLLDRADIGSTTNPILYGDANPNIFDPMGQAHSIVARGGGDTITYNRGYGALSIDESDTSATPDNVLVFGDGIAVTDVTVSADGLGNLVMALGGDDQITLLGAAGAGSGPARGLQSVRFADGTVWGADQLHAFATGYWDIGSAAQTMTIDEALNGAGTTPAIHIAANPADVAVTYGADLNKIIITTASGMTLEIDDVTDTQAVANQIIQFQDGTVWHLSDAIANIEANTPAPTALYGTGAAETFDLGATTNSGSSSTQVKTIFGGGGGDTFRYALGDGSVAINETDASADPHNTLVFGPGITLSSIRPTSQDGDLILHLSDGSAVTIAGALLSTADVTNGVEQVAFDDGSTVSYAQLLAQADVGAPGYYNYNLEGDSNANLIDPGSPFYPGYGYSTIVGRGGGDTVIFNRGYGTMNVTEDDISASPNNVLQLGPGIAPNAVTVSASSYTGTDIILNLGRGDQVTIANALTGTNQGFQQIVFADGTIWTRSTLLSMVETPPSPYAPIYGDETANVLDTQGIAHQVFGNGGGDTIVYGSGYGYLAIDERDTSSTPNNALQFTADFTPSDVTVSATRDYLSPSSLRFTLSTDDGGTITFSSTGDGALSDGTIRGVQTVRFADGTVWSLADLVARADTASPSNTVLVGDEHANILDSQGIATSLDGGGGGDTFVYQPGYGPLTITDVAVQGDSPNILSLGAGIDPSTVSVTADVSLNTYPSRNDLVLSFGGSDVVTISNALTTTDPLAPVGVQQVVFANGTIWSYADLLRKADTASPTNTTLYGDRGSNTLDPGGFAHLLVGNGGGDTFLYNIGDGAVTIDAVEDEDNTLSFGSGITASDLSVSATAAGDIVISVGASDFVTITGGLKSPYGTKGIQNVTFADGTTWSYEDLLTKADTPSPTNLTLYGDMNANTLSNGNIATTLVGNGGGDTFLYARGNGPVTIQEQLYGNTNILKFATGITASDVSVIAMQNGDMTLSLGGNDRATVSGEFADYPMQGVSLVQFADGTTWSKDDLVRLGHTGSPDNTTLYGGDGSETFDPNGYAHYISSGGGFDTVTYNAGYGAVTLDAPPPYVYGQVTVNVGAGISASDVSVSQDGNDAILTFDGQDALRIKDEFKIDYNWYGNSLENRIGQINFADGTSWSGGSLYNRVPRVNTPPSLVGDPTPMQLQVVADNPYPWNSLYGFAYQAFNDPDFGDQFSVITDGVTTTGARSSAITDETLISALYTYTFSENSAAYFSAPNDMFSYLGQGETLAIDYHVELDDNHGGSTPQEVYVTITGSNDTPTIDPATTASGSITQSSDGSGIDQIDTASGQLLFNDRDQDDTHAVLVTSVTASGNAAGLPDQADVAGWLSLDALAEPADGASGVVNWSFAAQDSAFDYLAAGDQVQLNYTAQISDENGASVSQTISVTVTGVGHTYAATITSSPDDETFSATPDIDTFAFGANFGHDTIEGFAATGSGHDYLQIDRSAFADWAHLLGATQQVGSDLEITLDANDSILLKNVALSSFTSNDVRFTPGAFGG